jgi:hypothetical protein
MTSTRSSRTRGRLTRRSPIRRTPTTSAEHFALKSESSSQQRFYGIACQPAAVQRYFCWLGATQVVLPGMRWLAGGSGFSGAGRGVCPPQFALLISTAAAACSSATTATRS